MVCTSCSAPLYADDVFCVHCGTRVTAAAAVGAADHGETRALAALRIGAPPAKDTCARCGTTLFAEDRFCQQCGATVDRPDAPASGGGPTLACPSCAHALFADDVFCVHCGTRVGASEPGPLSAKASTRVWAALSSGKTSITPPCPGCGTATVVGDRFCQQCGTSIEAAGSDALACHHCGAALYPDDVFCVGCGSRVGAGAPALPNTPAASGTRVLAALERGSAAVTGACPNCHSAVVADDRFCQNCGTALEQGSDAESITGERGGGAGAVELPLPVRDSADQAWDLVRQKLERLTLGEYDIARELGRGGMAAVYLAHDIALNRQVAIKVMAPGLLLGSGMVERFTREAQTVANLNHPHIIAIYTVRHLEDLHFFVMKFVEGNSLEHILDGAGPLSLDAIRLILHQVGTGLAYAHRRGIVHRDIKPANIVIDTDGNAILMDFGIAKVTQDAGTTQPGQTQAGTVVGTPAYMSPEQCYSAEVTWASDQYSLGIVAYEMLTGRAPFDGPSFAVMQAHTQTVPPSPRTLRPDCPRDLEAAVMRMLEKAPTDRFTSLSDALDALGAKPVEETAPVRTELAGLAQLQSDRSKSSRPRTPVSPIPGHYPATRSRRSLRSRNRWIAIGGVLAALGLGTVYWITRSGPSSPAADSTAVAPPGAPSVAAVRLSSARESVLVDQTVALRATVTDAQGNTLADKPVAWTSSDSSVAGVLGSGLEATVKGRKPGRVTVTAASEGRTQSAEVAVVAARAGALTVSSPAKELTVGQKVTLSAVVMDSLGKRVADPAIEWRSATPAVLEVGRDGSALAKAAGRVRVTASSGKQSGAIELEVRAPRPTLITVTPAQAGPLVAGRAARVHLGVEWEHGGSGSVARVVWRTSDPTLASVAAVDTLGNAAVTPLKEGQVSVIAELEGVRGAATLQIRSAQAVSLTLSQSAVLFEAATDGPPPAEQTVAVTVANAGENDRLSVGTIEYGSGASGWLTAVLQATTLTLRAAPKDAAAGTYRAVVPISVGAATRSVAVTLTVTEPKRVAIPAGGDADLEKIRPDLEALLDGYMQALRAKDSTQIRLKYPSISERGLNDVLKAKSSDFELQLRRNVPLKRGSREGTIDGEVIAGGIDGSRAGNARLIYTFVQGASGWQIAGTRPAGR